MCPPPPYLGVNTQSQRDEHNTRMTSQTSTKRQKNDSLSKHEMTGKPQQPLKCNKADKPKKPDKPDKPDRTENPEKQFRRYSSSRNQGIILINSLLYQEELNMFGT